MCGEQGACACIVQPVLALAPTAWHPDPGCGTYHTRQFTRMHASELRPMHGEVSKRRVFMMHQSKALHVCRSACTTPHATCMHSPLQYGC